MRALRVVGITEGGDVVLEDSGRRERFTVPADEQLRAAARGDLTRLGQIAIELESQLRPREIQARIRAGASVEQVASAAGVPIQKIERFAYPVLLERSRTAEVAQRAHPVRGDGPDVRTLGDVVAHTFGLRGQEYTEAEWDSWKGEDGRWLVALSWRAGRSDNRAHWIFQPGAHGGTVTSVDEHASDLVEGLPARPLRPVGPVIDIARPDEPAPAPQHPELRATASDPARERGPAPDNRAAEHRGRGSDRPTERSGERPADRTAVDQAQAPALDAPADRGIGQRGAGQRDLGERTGYDRSVPGRTAGPPAQRQAEPEQRRPEPARPEPARSEPEPASPASETEQHQDEPARAEPARNRPDPQARPTEPAASTTPDPPAPREEVREQAEAPAEPAAEAPATTSRRTKKGKPVMPSWDEVLLGVRGQR